MANVRKYRPDEDPDLSLVDRREGTWSKLELLEMDAEFCAAMRRVHPELVNQVKPERRRRA